MQRRRFNTEQAVRHILAVLGGAVTTGVVHELYGPSLVRESLVFFGSTLALGYFLGLYRVARGTELVGETQHMIGSKVRVMEPINPKGKILYHSKLWVAESDEFIDEGEWAEILSVHGRKLRVRKCERPHR